MQVSFGKVTVRKIPEAECAYPMVAMLPDVVPDDLTRLRTWFAAKGLSETPQSSVALLSVHSYVLQADGKNFLIDTCCGNDKTRTVMPFGHRLQSAYLSNLSAAGLTPEDIDYVLCTHLHYDHVGWNTRLENGRWVPTFKNARYLLTRLDYEFLQRHTTDPLYSEGYYDSVLPVIEHGLADLVETSAIVHRQIGDGVWLTGAPGHSPGSCCINASAGDATLLFSGDAFHHPIQLVRPDARFAGDDAPQQAARTRTELLSRSADENTVVFPAHFTGTSWGRVRRDGDAYRFEFLAAS